ncbi:MAG: tRNA pseudouridine(55) synthase TruB [Micrococcales bacterium]|nr:tRNA pseudouridine(55) synthase TruB [Micrococcales bacterium]
MIGQDHGVVLVDKPAGKSSQAAVQVIKRASGARRVGHAGTLDPAATGLLVIGVGAGTRLLTFLVGLPKTYRAIVRLGVGTDTDDAEGTVTFTPGCGAHVDVSGAVAQLSGQQLQVPATVSAVKVAGKRAYQRVRDGEDVDLPPRQVTVDEFRVENQAPTVVDGIPVLDLDIEVAVSSGTYVRALARDLGLAVGSAGHVRQLRRTLVGPFRLSDAVALDEWSPRRRLQSLGAVAAEVLPTRIISGDEAWAVAHGQRIPAEPGPVEKVALLNDDDDLLAVASIEEGRYRYAMVVPLPAIPAFSAESGSLG